ncbi:hypothetical protein C8F04DRAFT_1179303 [Mycena alexandri]|uniref:Uncharacterized protein n=1 Tax=Mycena alexandri TaxID=1745969 RepID=A0AAD6T7W7_9AGAR|nr:hypothetical protein C8F04DRAFT_1179303 [Mycena alexandri]
MDSIFFLRNFRPAIVALLKPSCHPIPLKLNFLLISGDQTATLGSLIAITFIHEGMHAYLRWRLGDSIAPAAFDTPELNPGRKGQSGWELEYLLFRGVVQVQLPEKDSKRADCFKRIENLWVQQTTVASEADFLRLIPNSHLERFYTQLLQSVLTIDTLIACFHSKSMPLTPQTVVCENDRVLLRLGPATGPNAVHMPVPFYHHPAPIPRCGIALRRAGNYGPEESADFWTKYLDGGTVDEAAADGDLGTGAAVDDA